jgi:hypothetical protein
MSDFDLTGKFGWYIALAICVLVPAIGLWFESKKSGDSLPHD